MTGKNLALLIIAFVLFGVATAGVSLYSFKLGQSSLAPKTSSSPSASPFITPSLSPTALVSPSPQVKPGWKVYQNNELGFEISYPENYRIVDDTYGWPKAVLLLYGGGQSYDLVIELWDLEQEYKNKYPGVMTNLTVKKLDNKYLTLLNQNFEAEVDEIIATFKIIP